MSRAAAAVSLRRVVVLLGALALAGCDGGAPPRSEPAPASPEPSSPAPLASEVAAAAGPASVVPPRPPRALPGPLPARLVFRLDALYGDGPPLFRTLARPFHYAFKGTLLLAQSALTPFGWRPGGHSSWRAVDDPERDREPLTRQVLEAVAARPGLRIADVGAGTGYFAFQFARQVAPGGIVYATELDPQRIIDLARERAARGAESVVPVLVDGHLELPPGSVDVILLVDVFAFQDCAPRFARRLLADSHAALTPGGRLVVAQHKRRVCRGGVVCPLAGGAVVEPRGEHLFDLCNDLPPAAVLSLAGDRFRVLRQESVPLDRAPGDEWFAPGYLLVLERVP